MNALIFLRAKGVLTVDCTKWKVKFKGGQEYDIIRLMEEYADCKFENNKHEIENEITKDCPHDYCINPDKCSAEFKCIAS